MMSTRLILAAALGALLLAGCSQAPQADPAAQAQAAAEAQAAKELEMYRTLLAQESWELAAPIGKEIGERFPGTAAAAEVAASLTEVTAKADAESRRRRLERLWSYQAGQESGGDQITASIYSADRLPEKQVRLILRRHSDWGQSAYLFGRGKGFGCGSPCTLELQFDDAAPVRFKAHLPDSGEPAIFISDDARFIERMAQAQRLRIGVSEKGQAPRTLEFEVGGYDATRFPPLARR